MRKTTVIALLVGLAVMAGAALAVAAERLELQVDGMVCPFCEATVESILRAHPGVIEADADFRARRAIVIYDPARGQTRERSPTRSTTGASIAHVRSSLASGAPPGHRCRSRCPP